MTTGKALNGKPYAGNPHVRFDEGEVASAAMPRRGSLLYDNCKKSTKVRVRGSFVALSPLWGFAILAVVTSTPVWAVNWTGNGADSLWSTKENWQNNTLPAANASLAFRVSNVGNKTATLDGNYSYTGNIHVGAGSSASAPYVFEATDPANTLTVQDDTWLGYYEDGALWLKSGTYVFNGKSGKNFHAGEGNKAVHNFWLKVGDGVSSVSMTTKGSAYVRGGSTFVADKATLTFNSSFAMNETSAAYFTNTTMSAQYFRLYGASSATLSNSTLTVSRDLNVPDGNGSVGTFTATDSTVHANGSGYVFNVGVGETATGTVLKNGGDWDCYYLRLGASTGASGTFTMNGGSLTVRTELGIGIGANSTGVFHLNGGTVSAQYIRSADGASSSLVIDGGTLKANGVDSRGLIEKPGLNVSVKSGGATVDTAGYDVVLNAAFNKAADAPNAALTVTGGGSAKFTAGGNLTGAFTVGEDTGIHWFDVDATVADYALASLTLGAGSTLVLDADATGCDTFTAASTNISATAEKKTTFKLLVRAMPESGRAFRLFEMTQADAANCEVVAETPAGASLVVEKGWADGYLTYAILAKDYVWGGGANGGGWTAGSNWLVDGAASGWENNNNAVFAAAGDKATLDASVTAVALDFRADATVDAAEGAEAAISTPEVVVAQGVSATVNAPLSSEFIKTGAGTLALGTNRTEQTAIEEGTLAVAGTASLDWTKLTFGTDPAKPVTLRVGAAATLANRPASWTVGTLANITSTVVKEGGDWEMGTLHVGGAVSAVTTFIHEGGTLTLTGASDISKDTTSMGHLDIAGGTVSHASYYFHLGQRGHAKMTVRAGAKYETTKVNNYGIIVGGTADATLDIAGGEVALMEPINFALYGAEGPNGVVNITAGGVLSCGGVVVNKSSAGGSGTLNIDGGALRAYASNAEFIPAKDNLSVTVGANGGTIDTNGKNVTIAKAVGGTGGLAFKGGGKVTFAAANTYTGATTVEVGTSVLVPSLASLGGGIAVTAPEATLADGVYMLLALTGGETFSESTLAGIATPAGCSLRLSNDRKAILCVVGNPGFVWVGGESGSLSEASNWANGAVPRSGDSCVIGNPTAASLTVGDTFAPSSITFPAYSALVTISGERALSGLTAIVNNAAQHHVFACPVDARTATPELTLSASGYIVFSGGIALAAMPSVDAMRLAGVWNLTGDWNTPANDARIQPGSEVNVSGTLRNGYNLVIEEGATLRAANIEAGQGEANKNRFLANNFGTLVVTGEMVDVMWSDNTTRYSLAAFFAQGSDTAVTRVNGLVNSASTQSNHPLVLNNGSNAATNTIVLGSGGLSFRDNYRVNAKSYPYFQVDSGKIAVLASSADWTIPRNTYGYGVTLELNGPVVIDTSDYDDRAVARTVHVLGQIGSSGSVTAIGCGRLAFESELSFGGRLYVQDAATAAVNAGCPVSRTEVSVASGATLELAQSGTVALAGALTLAHEAALGFNFTGREPPVLDVTDKTVTLGGTVVVKVSAVGKRPKGGANVLTAGGKFAGANVTLAVGAPEWVKGVSVVDGEIVLDAKATGMMVILR